jgi:pimeloyl-ACP methyl ester carboxylesterase
MQSILLPGGIMPASLGYADLLVAFDPSVDARAKELEVYSGETVPPPDYGLETEIAGVDRFADAAGFDRFHLVGYSAGGASSLAYAITKPERLLSLTLAEPAWSGVVGRSPEEAAAFDVVIAALSLDPDEMLPAFIRAQLADGVEPPPRSEGAPPPWMADRSPGTRALVEAFERFEYPEESLRAFARPVLFSLGGRSNPDYYARMAERLGGFFPDFTLEVFEERHHFDPPHRAEPDRYAALLEHHWRRAEGLSKTTGE